MPLQRPLHLMLIDNHAPDTQLVMSTFDTVTPAPDFTVFHDSAQALAHLRAADALPDLVLMGLRLTPLAGLDVLGEIKGDPDLRRLPVVILSSSVAPEDVQACYASYATAYLVRPVSLEELQRQMLGLWTFWTRWLRLPEA